MHGGGPSERATGGSSCDNWWCGDTGPRRPASERASDQGGAGGSRLEGKHEVRKGSKGCTVGLVVLAQGWLAMQALGTDRTADPGHGGGEPRVNRDTPGMPRSDRLDGADRADRVPGMDAQGYTTVWGGDIVYGVRVLIELNTTRSLTKDASSSTTGAKPFTPGSVT